MLINYLNTAMRMSDEIKTAISRFGPAASYGLRSMATLQVPRGFDSSFQVTPWDPWSIDKPCGPLSKRSSAAILYVQVGPGGVTFDVPPKNVFSIPMPSDLGGVSAWVPFSTDTENENE